MIPRFCTAALCLGAGNFFSLLGASPQLGRTFTEQDDAPGANHVAVLSAGRNGVLSPQPEVMEKISRQVASAVYNPKPASGETGESGLDGIC